MTRYILGLLCVVGLFGCDDVVVVVPCGDAGPTMAMVSDGGMPQIMADSGTPVIIGDMAWEMANAGFVGCSDVHLTQISWTVSDRSGTILGGNVATPCGATLEIPVSASWPTDLVVRVQGHSDLGDWNQACSATNVPGTHFQCNAHYAL